MKAPAARCISSTSAKSFDFICQLWYKGKRDINRACKNRNWRFSPNGQCKMRYTHSAVVSIAILAVVVCLCIVQSAFAGSIVAWGDNSYGQATPPDGNDFVAIAAGDGHSVALKSDGSIVVWGNNYRNKSYMPPDSNDFVAIAAGGLQTPKMILEGHSLALKSDGSIVTWGVPTESPPDGNDFIAIAAGGGHSLALKSDGSVVGWGNNSDGQATPPEGNDFISISAGADHSLALKSDGSIVGWGNNYHGQASPPDGNDFVAISAGGFHSLALKSDGSIVGWGNNSNDRATPPEGNNFVAITAGRLHSLALKSSGSIVSWPTQSLHAPPPGNDFVAIAAGYNHSLALKKDCQYVLQGDLNNDCKVDFTDFALMASHWLIDCDLNPEDPACVPKNSSSHIFLKPPGSYHSPRRSIIARIPANGSEALAR